MCVCTYISKVFTMDASAKKFHDNCLKDWDTKNCPVCCYIKNPGLIKKPSCMKCATDDSLWVCIICGHIGCGRRVHRHALEHYQETEHKYVMKLQGFRVYDYKLKQVIHQLDANEQTLENSNDPVNAPVSACLVCQYNLTPKLLKDSTCMTCEVNQEQNLWMCLSCSHIGCSRMNNWHAFQHYTKTKHPYAIQLYNFSIWDYKGKKYLDSEATKSEISEICSGHLLQDFLKRMERLENKWQEFTELTKANKQMIIIEQRLLNLTDEKKILEKTLYEHDAKLNELLAKVAAKGDKLSPTEHSKSDKIETAASVPLEKPSRGSNFLCNNKLFITVYYFFKLCFQKIAEKFMNLLKFLL